MLSSAGIVAVYCHNNFRVSLRNAIYLMTPVGECYCLDLECPKRQVWLPGHGAIGSIRTFGRWEEVIGVSELKCLASCLPPSLFPFLSTAMKLTDSSATCFCHELLCCHRQWGQETMD